MEICVACVECTLNAVVCISTYHIGNDWLEYFSVDYFFLDNSFEDNWKWKFYASIDK